MSSLAARRLMKDFQTLKEKPIPGLAAVPTANNIYFWKGIVIGPPDTPYEDGTFTVIMIFPGDYPMKPPKVNFDTIMFHPNVYRNGVICMDILDNRWSSLYDVSGLLQSIRCLLSDPNPDSPANPIAARLFVNDYRAFRKEVLKTVDKSFVSVGLHTLD